MPISQNYSAIPFPPFQRAMRNILTISQDTQCIVTTTFNGTDPGAHQYMTGLIVRLIIPVGFGMQQANQLSGPIKVINSTQFTMPIDTTQFDPFSIPQAIIGSFYTPAQVVPIGEVNDILTGATQNVLPYV